MSDVAPAPAPVDDAPAAPAPDAAEAPAPAPYSPEFRYVGGGTAEVGDAGFSKFGEKATFDEKLAREVIEGGGVTPELACAGVGTAN